MYYNLWDMIARDDIQAVDVCLHNNLHMPATVAALESTRIIEEENLVENSRVIGDYLLDRLRELLDHPAVGDVRGKGLFCT